MSANSSPESRSSDGTWTPATARGSAAAAAPGRPEDGQGPHRDRLPPGTIGPYRPLELIGSGGMGQVFRAEDPVGTVVAVKTLHPHLVNEDAARIRLRREVETMGRVNTPRVAGLVEFADPAARPAAAQLVERLRALRPESLRSTGGGSGGSRGGGTGGSSGGMSGTGGSP